MKVQCNYTLEIDDEKWMKEFELENPDDVEADVWWHLLDVINESIAPFGKNES